MTRRWDSQPFWGLIFTGALLVSSVPAAYSTESRLEETRDRRYPYIQTARPTWGLELTAGAGLSPGISFAGAALRFEWQPPWIQAGGILSIGPALDYTIGVLGGGVGGVARYQLRYFRQQPVVPFFGYTALFYVGASNLSTVSNTTFTTNLVHGPFVGGNIFLNFFDDDSAAEFFVNTGVLRSYLVAEVRFMQNVMAGLPTANGPCYYFGLRFEF